MADTVETIDRTEPDGAKVFEVWRWNDQGVVIRLDVITIKNRAVVSHHTYRPPTPAA